MQSGHCCLSSSVVVLNKNEVEFNFIGLPFLSEAYCARRARFLSEAISNSDQINVSIAKLSHFGTINVSIDDHPRAAILTRLVGNLYQLQSW